MEVAEALLSHPHVSAVSRIQALVAVGLVRARRGEPGVYAALDEALELALETAELQRVGPVRAARSEAAWLEGDLHQARAEASAGYELALGHDYYAYTAELALCLWRCGGLDMVLPPPAAPFAVEVTGDWQAAAQRWEGLGVPYEAALALADGDEAAMRQALHALDELGATPVAALVARRLRKRGAGGIPRGPHSATRANAASLTRRELEILRLVAAGQTSREIAECLFLSRRTVEMHVANSLGKLRARSRAEAVRRAGELKLLES
jgi:DNA-binding CsgD family transcriptional regulator